MATYHPHVISLATVLVKIWMNHPAGRAFKNDIQQALRCLSNKEEVTMPWVVLTGADWGYRGVLFNWIRHMEKISVSNYLVLCYDSRTLDVVGSFRSGGHGVLVSNCNTSEVHRSPQGVRTNVDMTQKMLMKHVAVGMALSEGVTAVWSDVDALWLSPFLSTAVLREWTNADIVGQMGTFPETVFRKKGVSLCTGLFVVFPSHTSIAFYDHMLVTIQETGRYQSDQLALNELLDSVGAFDHLLVDTSLDDALQWFDLPFRHFNRRRYDKEFITSRSAVNHTVLFSDPPVGIPRIGLLPFSKFPRDKTRHWKAILSGFAPSIYHMLSMKNGTRKVLEFQNDGVFMLENDWDSNTHMLWKHHSSCVF